MWPLVYSGIFVFIFYTAFFKKEFKWLPLVSRERQYHFGKNLVLEQKWDFIYIYAAEASYQYVVVTEETERMYPLLLRYSLKLPKISNINSYLSAAHDGG